MEKKRLPEMLVLCRNDAIFDKDAHLHNDI